MKALLLGIVPPALLFLPPRDGGPDWIAEPLDNAKWQVLYWIGQAFWWIDRQMLQFAVMLHDARKFISDPGGLIQIAMEEIFRGSGSVITSQLLAGMLQAAFTLLVLMLALRAHNWDFEWVTPRKVILFFFVVVALFQTGSQIFTSAEAGRMWLQQAAHALGDRIGARVSFDMTGGEVAYSPRPGPPPAPVFANTTRIFSDPQNPDYSGVALTAYYLGGATQDEINDQQHVALPSGLRTRYFMNGGAQPWPDGCDANCRQAALDNAVAGLQLLFGGVFSALYAILEAALYLVMSFSVLLIFIGTPIALAFSFFNGTEIMANALLRAYFGLMQKTWTYALILGVLNGALVYWARSDNDGAFVGIACAVDLVTLFFVIYATATIRHALHTQTNTMDHSSAPAATVIMASMAAMALRGMPSFGSARGGRSGEEALGGGPVIWADVSVGGPGYLRRGVLGPEEWAGQSGGAGA
jgi:hypothetical protein